MLLGGKVKRQPEGSHGLFALEAVCCSEAKSKDSLDEAMGYLLQTAAEVMQGVYLGVGRDEASKEMKKFVKILKYKWGELFGYLY